MYVLIFWVYFLNLSVLLQDILGAPSGIHVLSRALSSRPSHAPAKTCPGDNTGRTGCMNTGYLISGRLDLGLREARPCTYGNRVRGAVRLSLPTCYEVLGATYITAPTPFTVAQHPRSSYPLTSPGLSHSTMSHPEVHGVVVISRNGDHGECYQDPISYKAGASESTPFGEVQAHRLGAYLRDVYFNPDSPSRIRGINTDLVDLKQVHVRVKVGGEGASVFDSATATLQGLFPPNPKNKITLADETVVVAPLGGGYRHFYVSEHALTAL